jgi:hypothetical protein
MKSEEENWERLGREIWNVCVDSYSFGDNANVWGVNPYFLSYVQSVFQ